MSGWCNLPPRQECAGPQSQPPAMATASHMWQSKGASERPDVANFPLVISDMHPLLPGRYPRCADWPSLCSSSLEFWILPEGRAGTRTCPGPPRLIYLEAGTMIFLCLHRPPPSHPGSPEDGCIKSVVHHDKPCSHARQYFTGHTPMMKKLCPKKMLALK